MRTKLTNDILEAVRKEARVLDWGDDTFAGIVDGVLHAIQLGSTKGCGRDFREEVDKLAGEIVGTSRKLRNVRQYKWRDGPQGFDEYLDNRWVVDDASSAPADKFIRKENQSELIEQAALHGVFDEMRCARRYINVKRYVNKHPRLRMVDKRIQQDGERFSCNVIERKPETEGGTNN